LAVAELRAALRTRPGHVVVIGDDAAAVAGFFAQVEKDFLTWRRVRVPGHGLVPESVVVELWGGNVDDRTTLRPRAMMQALVTAARLIERPILVVVTDAHAAGVESLERLRAMLDCAPDASQIVRLALLGDRRLVAMLRQREARALATSVATTVRVPPPGGE